MMFSQSKPVAGSGGGSKRQVLLVGGKQRLAAPLVVRETSGSEHDAPARLDLHLPGKRFQYSAARSVAIFQQPNRWGRGAEIDAEIGGASQQACHKGVPVTQLHSPPA
jgi:hypothetical protein